MQATISYLIGNRVKQIEWYHRWMSRTNGNAQDMAHMSCYLGVCWASCFYYWVISGTHSFWFAGTNELLQKLWGHLAASYSRLFCCLLYAESLNFLSIIGNCLPFFPPYLEHTSIIWMGKRSYLVSWIQWCCCESHLVAIIFVIYRKKTRFSSWLFCWQYYMAYEACCCF